MQTCFGNHIKNQLSKYKRPTQICQVSHDREILDRLILLFFAVSNIRPKPYFE